MWVGEVGNVKPFRRARVSPAKSCGPGPETVTVSRMSCSLRSTSKVTSYKFWKVRLKPSRALGRSCCSKQKPQRDRRCSRFSKIDSLSYFISSEEDSFLRAICPKHRRSRKISSRWRWKKMVFESNEARG